jgi:pimeloyl-ACP methyl ester carboxylesterase
MNMIQVYIERDCQNSLMSVLRLRDDKKYENFCIFLPGYGCYKDEMSYLFSTIAKKMNNTNSILFDYFGCGDSDGDFSEVDLESMVHDAKRVLEYVKTKYNAKKINIVARGAGVIVALNLLNSTCEDFFSRMVFIDNPLKNDMPKISSDVLINWNKSGSMEFRELLLALNPEVNQQFTQWISGNGWVFPAERISYSFIEQMNNLDHSHVFDRDLLDTLIITFDNRLPHIKFGKNVQITINDSSNKYFSATEVDQMVIETIDWLKDSE